MKKFHLINSLAAAALLLLGAACSSDTLDPGKEPGKLKPDTSGGIYMAVDFTMPDGSSSTRSKTEDDGSSSDGIEIGSEEENNVTTALIVLASTEAKATPGADTHDLDEFGYIVAGEVQSNRISYLTESNNKQYRATARLQKENLNTLYGLYWNESQQTYDVPPVYVFVFCNPTKELVSLFHPEEIEFGDSQWLEKVCKVTQGEEGTHDYNVGIWGANSFLMNNVSLAERLLPENLLDWEYFTSVDKPFHLSDKQDVTQVSVDNSSENVKHPGGSIKVERSVARFDFKDGSPDPKNRPNTYDVLFLTDKDGNIDNATPIVQVQLQKMCLVNMSNSFYYIPRVSETGQNTNITYLGKEKPWSRGNNGQYSGGNYVVGPYAQEFNAGVTKDFSLYFNYPFFDNNGLFSNPDNNAARWNVVKIESVLEGTPDNYEVGTGENAVKGTYHVWRYVTENVIPDPIANQRNGVSTGIVFKGKIGGTSKALENGLYEEYWNEGYIANLAKCLNNVEDGFTYNGVEHTKLTGNSAQDPIIYYFSGRLYMGWRHIRQAAIQASVTMDVSNNIEINRSNSLYKAVFGDGPIPDGMLYIPNIGTAEAPIAGKGIEIIDPRWTDANANHSGTDYQNYLKSANYAWSQWAVGGKEEGDDTTGTGVGDILENMRKAVTGAGITIFQSSYDEDYGAGYYCYYYYWNRHNDNGIDGSMGPMEFDVVRNNVYKLSVDKIARIGHPRIPENDPNNPTPTTPDESDEIYLDVRVQIAPWVVRLNSIKF